VQGQLYPTTNQVSPLDGYLKARSERLSDWLIHRDEPQGLSLGSTFYAVPTSSISDWLSCENVDHSKTEPSMPTFEIIDHSQSDQISNWLSKQSKTSSANDHCSFPCPLTAYFAQRSEDISDWLIKAEKNKRTQISDEDYKWLSVQKVENESADTISSPLMELAQKSNGCDKYANWLHKSSQMDSENKESSDLTADFSEKLWLISATSQDNKDCVEEMSEWLTRCPLSATKVESQGKEILLSPATSNPGGIDPATGPTTLFSCFDEKSDTEKWLVA
jgi:hypothetical protein